jgi:GNAT superfamily N-acetyltransferase
MFSINLEIDCQAFELSDNNLITDFDCSDKDLNDFFNRDAILYQNERLGKTFFYRHKETGQVVCAFSLSADSVKTFLLTNNRRRIVKKLLPHEKSLQSYPAMLIGRLGVSTELGGHGIGSQLMEIIKEFCFNKFKHYVRFLTVDAYNKTEVLNFYEKNDFNFLFLTEEDERQNLKKSIDSEEPLNSRQMFFDLKRYE